MDGISLELTRPRLLELSPEETGDESKLRAQRPALFAGYVDLRQLRYDYPLVLAEDEGGSGRVQSLTGVVDDLIRKVVPPGSQGKEFRWQLLHLEQTVRELVANGAQGLLSQLWRKAEANLAKAIEKKEDRDALVKNLDLGREVLEIDGQVIDCDDKTPVRFLVHAWNTTHEGKAKAFRKRVDGLILKLSDILKADFVKSDKARSPEILKSAVGDTFNTDFDFDAMSRVLVEGSHADMLSEERRKRIEAVLMVLQSQRFYGPGRASGPRVDDVEPYTFVFDNCAAAMDAFRDRLPQMVDFIEAVSIAELEIRNKYRPDLHDPFFERFDESELTAEDLALFPSYLVCLRDGKSDAAEMVRALEALASGFPVKVMIQTDDILGDSSPEPPRTSFGGGSARLAAMALGVNNAYVFQTASASLCRLQERVLKGLRYDGPALFSIYSGATKTVSDVSPYLLSAAATESRAFPSFTYDPAAGPDWASRFDIRDNPHVESGWTVHTLSFEDEALQKVTHTAAFTHVDFAICDSRFEKHWVPTSRSKWMDSMVPAGELLSNDQNIAANAAPYVWTVDANYSLRRTVVDDQLINSARRCAETWRSLQELGGIGNSHARRQLESARQEWERDREARDGPNGGGEPPQPAAEAPSDAARPEPEESVAEAEPLSPDDAYIETSRCTTCNECTQINNKMFVYNENKQAYIADVDAGSYRQMVEAAESCQVSIIHPGKPRDPDEPNLAELIERAEPFN
jgi:ferredoxin